MCRSLVLWSRAQAASLTLESSSTLICFWAPVEGQATLTCGIAERERERDKARSLAQELRQSKPDDWGDGRRAGRRPSRAVTVPHRSSTPAILLVVVDDPHLHVVVRSSVWVGCARRVALLLWLLDPLDPWAPPFFFFPSCVEIRSCGIPLADPAAEAAAEVTSRRKWENNQYFSTFQ